MIGKKNILMVSMAIVFLTSNTSSAFLGFGDVVTDPGSYAYYAEQIGVSGKQLAEMKKTYSSLVDMKNQLKKSYKTMKGHYNRGMKLYKKIQKLKKILDKEPTTFQTTADKWASVANLAGADINRHKLKKVLRTNFEDPEQVVYLLDYLDRLEKRGHIRKTQVARAVEETEVILRKIPDRMKEIEELTKQVDETENLKDANDLNNTILVEILSTLQEMLKIASHVGQAQMIQYYTAPEDEIKNDAAERTAQIENSLSEFQAHLRKNGVRGDFKDRDRRKLMGLN